jgi:hypothetical protein
MAPTALPPPEAIHRERCRRNFAHFADTYCQVLSETAGPAPAWVAFRLWPSQLTVARQFQDERLLVILKARQLGLTWLALAFALWHVLLHPVATVLLFSRRDDEATELLGRLKLMHGRLPPWLQARRVVTDNDHEWGLESGSRAMAFPTTAGDSYTATLAIVDEADLVPDLDRLLRAVKPTIDAAGRLLLIGRADKGQPESAFKRVYRAARAGGSGWVAVFLPWHARPDRDAAWYEAQRRDVLARTGATDDLFEQYPATDAEALAPRSLDKRLPAEWLNKCYWERAAAVPQPEAPSIPGLEVYAPPVLGRRYVIGADPAEGNPTSDDSALEVLDADSGEECAALAGRFDPTVFAGHVATVSAFYNRASALVERNNHGHAVLLWLRDNTEVELLRDHDGRDGWNTTSKSKAQMWTTAADAFRGGNTLLHSFATLTQLTSIEGATLRAPDGQKDDRAVAYALGLQAVALDVPPDFNIRVFDLSPQPLTTRSPEPTLPQLRYFAPNAKWQPVPVIWGQPLYAAPDFRTEAEAAYFVRRVHEALGSRPPDCEPFDIDPEKAAAVEKAVTAFLKSKRLLPLTTN